ncbi:23S ribosomal RNA methyltransferase Erm [Corynebacterium pacaense]|uniref:23S ribosomal RNA methyltransferase Erm n=1 Tax=Corynebacterium pacaense TaxID=1816684 RepID=UPI0011779812|nr:23S ribosomal RNA methyltransferase Erm [Corynebacterium pacaense]
MSAYSSGRHEHGQNFLTDPRAVDLLLAHVHSTSGPIVEIGGGDGALTHPMAHLDRPLTVLEIDEQLSLRLKSTVANDHVHIINADFLRYRLPGDPHVVIGNIPFHLTTAILRRLLRAPAWTDSVLLMQWEVARRRAGVGASTMMTAQWSPWFEFTLGERIPARSFTPRPAVDGGVLIIRRRTSPILPVQQRKSFHELVHSVYTGRGRGLQDILERRRIAPRSESTAVVESLGIHRAALPSELTVEQWAGLFMGVRRGRR